MTVSDVLFVVACAAGVAAVVGAVAWALLRIFAGAKLMLHVITLVAAAVLAVVGGVLVAAQAMYLSETDVQLAIAIAVTSGVVAIAVAVLLGARVSRAAGTLRDAARNVGVGRPLAASTSALPIGEFRDVLAELAATDARLRSAAERIHRQQAARQELVVRIAHDLRLPLAGIRAQAEALQDGLAADPDRFLSQIVGQVDRVNRLVDDLFAISRIDAGELTLRRQPVSLGDLASDTAADMRAIADAHGIGLDVEVHTDATVSADPHELGRAIGNLLANALQHTTAGGRIVLRVDADADRAEVSVADDGDGIAADDLDRLFDAGWRGTTARSPHVVDISGGAGLGLAIARGIARAHGGDVTAANLPGGGAIFTISVPVAMDGALGVE